MIRSFMFPNKSNGQNNYVTIKTFVAFDNLKIFKSIS